MNDPHVTAVHYNLVFGETVNFQPPSLSEAYSLPGFTAALTGQHLMLEPMVHYASAEDVRQVCEPLVKAWQITIAIKLGVIDVRFEYDKTDIEDRAPTPGVATIYVPSIPSGEWIGIPTVIQTVNQYPQPADPDFKWTPDVDSLWYRYCGYKRGREPLQAMAYFVLTVFEVRGGGTGNNVRPSAASRFHVDLKILKGIGTLSTERGDSTTARKLEPNTTPVLLTRAEKDWLDLAIRKLIVQVGRGEMNVPTTPLTLADLVDVPGSGVSLGRAAAAPDGGGHRDPG
jgi:hypothetical protein